MVFGPMNPIPPDSSILIPAPRFAIRRILALLLAGAAAWAAIPRAAAQAFVPGDLLVSRSVYAGTASTVTIGQTLPGGGTAIANGSYPDVFNNDGPDSSFGVTAPIFLDELTTTGSLVNSLNVTSLLGGAVTTSFSSKSEMALNLSTNGKDVTFMGYVAPENTLDVSNSNTPNHVDSTNPVAGSYQRAIIELGANGTVTDTPVDSYSGNNGRAAILSNGPGGTGLIYTVGNAGNGSGTEPTSIVTDTGVQFVTPGGGPATTVVGNQHGTAGSSKGFQFGFSVTQNGDTADKSGKDDNFRGETIFNNTLYVTKGSGSNGINTVYQVGTTGSLPTAGTASSTAINILPGFSTTLASSTTGVVMHPFGIWFANADTLYVADEGAGTTNFTGPEEGGLEKWSLEGSTWVEDYNLTEGLDLGVDYDVGSYFPTATDGLRNLTGVVNSNGTVTLFAVTSTVSGSGDQGADPNEVVSITDTLADTNIGQASGESFSVIDGPVYGNVYRGVSFTPVADSSSSALLLGFGLLLLAGLRWVSGRRGAVLAPALPGPA